MSSSAAGIRQKPSSARFNGSSDRENISSTRPSRSSAVSRDRIRVPSRDTGSATGSPTTPEQPKKIPPIKAPVGLAKGPDLKHVSSKIGSLDNVKHKPAGGDKKALTQKLDWNAKSKIGSLENRDHRPGGGEIKVTTQKLEWKVSSRVGSLNNVKHKPGGGNIQIFDEKYRTGSSRSSSQIRSSAPLSTSCDPPTSDATDSTASAKIPPQNKQLNSSAPDAKTTNSNANSSSKSKVSTDQNSSGPNNRLESTSESSSGRINQSNSANSNQAGVAPFELCKPKPARPAPPPKPVNLTAVTKTNGTSQIKSNGSLATGSAAAADPNSRQTSAPSTLSKNQINKS